MAVALSHPPQNSENLETYCLMWVDGSVNASSDNRHAQQQLKKTIHHLLTFEDDQQCLRYIKNLSKIDRIILIASGRSGRQIVPQIANLRQIISIYIYCMDKKANEQWAQQFTKVKGVIVRLDELIQQIQKDYTDQQSLKLDESLTIKFSDHEQFLSSQLVLDSLLRIKSSPHDQTELIAFCKEYYQTNHSQLMIIKEFEKDYSPERVLWWYTRHAFLSRLLNKALGEENMHLLYLFRFILHDIACQLGKSRSSTIMQVYRSHLMSKEELQSFKRSMGKLISINSFLSTSVNTEKTRLLLHKTDFSDDTEKVFFQIEADPQLRHSRPFSNIQSKSYFPKVKEILFMVGSIFRIEQIDRDQDQIWTIRLVLSSTNDTQLKSVFQDMKKELGNGNINLLRFGQILRQMGKLDNLEKYPRRYLNQLPNHHPDIPQCYQAMARIAESKKNFPGSLKWYKKSLDIFEQSKEVNYSHIAEIYHHIANVYFKTNDYTNAIKSYQKALELWEKTLGENHPQIVKCWNDMGAVYDMKKKYTEAMGCYEKALEIAKKNKDSDMAMTLRNMANVYELQGQFKQALSFYRKAIKIYQDSSSSSKDAYVQDLQASIQRVSSKLK